MSDVLLAVLMLVMLLLVGDIAVTLYFAGIKEFLAPAYVHRLPGGAIYWFLIRGGKA